MDNNTVSKLFDLHSKKIELYNEIVKLDEERANKQDKYRAIALQINKIEGHYSRETH